MLAFINFRFSSRPKSSPLRSNNLCDITDLSPTSMSRMFSTESIAAEEDYSSLPVSDEEDGDSMLSSSSLNHVNQVLSSVLLSSRTFRCATVEDNYNLARQILRGPSCNPLKTDLLAEVNTEGFSRNL
jgi:hypothetical protein